MIKEKTNIIEILKNYPKGTKLYSPICGEATLLAVGDAIAIKTQTGDVLFFNKYGIYNTNYINAECLLFPSKENHDLSTFKSKKFNYKTLKTSDKVLVRDTITDDWKTAIFLSIDTSNKIYKFLTVERYIYCIPYNDNTKHLVGTTDEAPEYYRY